MAGRWVSSNFSRKLFSLCLTAMVAAIQRAHRTGTGAFDFLLSTKHIEQTAPLRFEPSPGTWGRSATGMNCRRSVPHTDNRHSCPYVRPGRRCGDAPQLDMPQLLIAEN